MATAEKTWRGSELSVVKNEMPEKQDVDRLLELAEKTKEKCERLQQRIRHLSFWQVGVAATYSCLGLSLVVKNYSNLPSISEMIAFGSFAVLAFIFIVFYTLGGEKRQCERVLGVEKLALEETVGLIREVEPLISQKEGWSLLKRAEFRIRISKFGIGTQTLL